MGLFSSKTKQINQKIDAMEGSIKEAFGKVRNDIDSANAWLRYYYQKSQYFESQLNSSLAATDQLKKKLSEVSNALQNQADSAVLLSTELKKLMQEIQVIKSNFSKKYIDEEINFYIEKIYDKIHKLDKKIEDFSYLPAKVDSIKDKVEEHLISHDDTPVKEINYNIEKLSKEIFKVNKKIENFSYLPSNIQSIRSELAEHIKSTHIPVSVEKRIDQIQEKLKNIIVKKTPKEKLIQKVSKSSHDYIKAVVISYIKKYEKISALQLREMVVEEQNITSKSTFYRILEEIEQVSDISTIWEGKEKIYLAKLKKTA